MATASKLVFNPTEMETALLLVGLGSLVWAIIFVAMWVSRRSARSKRDEQLRQNTVNAKATAAAERRPRTKKGGFRPMQDAPPVNQEGFRSIQDVAPVREQMPQQPHKVKQGGTMRCMGEPSEPAVDWVTGRVLRPAGKENKT